jgi:DNA-binding CsgD family transcriptional regulator
MARAWKLATRPADLSSTKEALAIVNCAGRLIAMSPAAEKLVSAGEGIALVANELLPSERRLQSLWRDTVRQVALAPRHDDEAFLLPRSGSMQPLLATIGAVPLRSGFGSYARDVLIRVVNLQAPHADIRVASMRVWGLTPAQARLLQALVDNNFALRDAADRLGITYTTVRTQLASVFAKTGTCRQPELMRLATSLAN